MTSMSSRIAVWRMGMLNASQRACCSGLSSNLDAGIVFGEHGGESSGRGIAESVLGDSPLADFCVGVSSRIVEKGEEKFRFVFGLFRVGV